VGELGRERQCRGLLGMEGEKVMLFKGHSFSKVTKVGWVENLTLGTRSNALDQDF
jgi:hypothetical protein